MAPFMQHGDEGVPAIHSSAAASHPPPPAIPASESTPTASIARSMSRYRKRASSTAVRAGVAASQTLDATQHQEPHRARALPGATPAITPSSIPTSAAPPVPSIPLQHVLAQGAGDAARSRQASLGDGGNGSPINVASPTSRPPPPRLAERQHVITTPSAPASREPSTERGSRSRSVSRHATRRRARTNSQEQESSQRGRVELPKHTEPPVPQLSQQDSPADASENHTEEMRFPMPMHQEAALETAHSSSKLRKKRPSGDDYKAQPVSQVPGSHAPVSIPPVSHAPAPQAPKSHTPVSHAPTQIGKPAHAPSVGIISGGGGIVPQTDAPISHAPIARVPASHAPAQIGKQAHAPSVGIVSGGGGIVPQTDAPTSAVNTGDQVVTVKCQRHKFRFDVDADTSPADIIAKCARLANEPAISTSNCIVHECYDMLGLERRIRNFETIREVLNSWDQDAENWLSVRVRESGDTMKDLDIASVPKSMDPPKGCQTYMYHSNKPGKWNKRHITILDNGQIISSKKENAYAGDKDSTGLCRISDYDIYEPCESHIRRHLKPPKRYCFAVKSQQKSTVFMNTDNYVQYFSTDDSSTAKLFRDKVQGWRSWYLVDRLPDPKAANVASPPRASGKKGEEGKMLHRGPTVKHATRPSVNTGSGHRPRASIDESPYSIGDFKPLLDMSHFDNKRLSQFGMEEPVVVPQRTVQERSVPEVASPRRISPPRRESPRRASNELTHSKRNSLTGRGLIDNLKVDDGFTGNGLLGNTYEGRREAATQMSPDRPSNGLAAVSSAFAEGPTLLNQQARQDILSPTDKSSTMRPTTSGANQSNSRYRSQQRGSSQQRSGSRDQYPPPSNSHFSHGMAQAMRPGQPRPLVDVEEQAIHGPPQWNKRKGHGVKAPEGVERLVDFISPADPLRSGPRQGTMAVPGTIPSRHNTTRQPQQHSAQPTTSSSRTRSMSMGNGSSSRAAMMAQMTQGRGGQVPPMPPMPTRALRGDAPAHQQPSSRSRSDPARERELKERERRRRREEEREYKEREAAFNAVPGRHGTLKVV